jgi:hypothetical protein
MELHLHSYTPLWGGAWVQGELCLDHPYKVLPKSADKEADMQKNMAFFLHFSVGRLQISAQVDGPHLSAGAPAHVFGCVQPQT